MRIEIDMSEVRTLAADLRAVDSRLVRHARPKVEEHAINVRNRMRDHMADSGSFGHLARSITHDVVDDGFGAEVGPVKTTGGRSGLHRGANIAYWGSSKGGGGVTPPEVALRDEIAPFSRSLADLAAELTLG